MPDLQLTDLVRWWRDLGPSAGATRVLAVEGRSGSGKTALAADVAALAPEAAVVTMDEIYPGWDGLAPAVPLLVEQVLEPLALGRPAGLRRWDWTANRPGTWRPVAPAPLLLLEGIGCGALACAPYLSGLVWVEAPPAMRRERALARDGATYEPHWERWAAQEEAYLAASDPRSRADVVVDGAAAVPGAPRVPLLADRRHRPETGMSHVGGGG